MGEKLTEAQRETLVACMDWKAPFEVADLRRKNGWSVYTKGVQPVMSRLARKGLLEYGPANHTYRTTPAGRVALSRHGEGK